MDAENLTLPDEGDDALDLDPDGYRLVRRLDAAKRALALWAEEQAKARQEIINLAGTASRLRYGRTVVVTVSRSRPRRFDERAFAADHPDLYEAYKVAPEVDEIRVRLGRDLPDEPARGRR